MRGVQVEKKPEIADECGCFKGEGRIETRICGYPQDFSTYKCFLVQGNTLVLSIRD